MEALRAVVQEVDEEVAISMAPEVELATGELIVDEGLETPKALELLEVAAPIALGVETMGCEVGCLTVIVSVLD